MPVVAPRTAASRSASAKTTLGDFPPSSRWTFVRFSAADRMTFLPVVTDPVKEILST